MTTVAAVAVVAPPGAAAGMTIPVTAGLRADSPSEAGVAQLPSGLLKDCEIGSRPLSTFAELPAPVSGSPHPFHELNQVATEIPESTASAR